MAHFILLFILLTFSYLPFQDTAVSHLPLSDFQLVKYNHPQAEVDLGTGLWAWPLPMDYDRDGDLDLLVSCPDVPFNGLYFFENPGGESFPIFNPPVKIAPGIKNIQLSFVEDQPQVTVGAMGYAQFTDSLFRLERSLFDAKELEKQHQKIRFKQWKWVDYENDGDLDLIVGMDDWGDYGWDNAFDTEGNWTNGPLHGYVYLVENQADQFTLKGKLEAAGKPIDVYGAPSPNLADFDGDGDLDLICGEFVDKLSWFENTGTRQQPQYAEARYLANENGIIKMDLQMIIPVSIDWDRDGDEDLIIGDEDGRVAWMENTGQVKDRMPLFRSPVYFRQKADNLKFGALVTPVSVDWDEDGDEDLICGNTAGYIGFLENLDGGDPPKWAAPQYLKAEGETIRILAGPKGSIQGPCEAKWGYTTLSVADWDGDQLKDLVVNSIWGKVIWFKNSGTKGSPQLRAAQALRVAWGDTIPKPAWNWWAPEPTELATQWRTTPYTIDWNQDGLMDLVMLDHEGYLAFFERFERQGELWLHPGRRIFHSNRHSVFDSKHRVLDQAPGPLRLNGNPNGSSGRRKFCFVDWDLDGDLDLLINSVNISFLENTGAIDGISFFMDQGPLSGEKLAGHTTSPTVVDWDNNGVPDLLTGAEDGHLYYLKNNHVKK